FADVPYHMMYTERDLVAVPIERGQNVPDADQRVQHSIRELNGWNDEKFAERPAGETAEQSVQAWRETRDRVRGALSSLSDDQMTSLTWFPLVGCGWVPAMVPAS
ncbi:MAG: hypothetical protein GTN93_02905, partial [Anaerolineae bacterium]|nr:hypothetical protein [Anaerolineae bacterium]